MNIHTLTEINNKLDAHEGILTYTFITRKEQKESASYWDAYCEATLRRDYLYALAKKEEPIESSLDLELL